ncbi:MAG: hypothetical protein R3E58_20040 [Phycisphaerae bacterium]
MAGTCNVDTCAAGADPCPLGEVCDEVGDAREQPDCNTNGIGDLDDIAGGTAMDSNSNGVPDECEGCTSDAECDDGLFLHGRNSATRAFAFRPAPDVCLDNPATKPPPPANRAVAAAVVVEPADGDNDGVLRWQRPLPTRPCG